MSEDVQLRNGWESARLRPGHLGVFQFHDGRDIRATSNELWTALAYRNARAEPHQQWTVVLVSTADSARVVWAQGHTQEATYRAAMEMTRQGRP